MNYDQGAVVPGTYPNGKVGQVTYTEQDAFNWNYKKLKPILIRF
jgi:hypothetical protein